MDITNFYKIYRISMEFKSLIQEAYPKKMSTLAFFILLHVSKKEEGYTQYELAKSMSLQSSRVNILVRELVNEGLLLERALQGSRSKIILKTSEQADLIVESVVDSAHKKIDYIDPEGQNYEEMLEHFFTHLIA